jgi:hypothetical protein
MLAVSAVEGKLEKIKKNLRIFCRSIKKGRIEKLFQKE